MSDESRPDKTPPETRPVDLGLSEGKALTFSPTAVAVPIDAPAIGGTAPSASMTAAPQGEASPAPTPATPPAASDD